jgi:hypothetical protein
MLSPISLTRTLRIVPLALLALLSLTTLFQVGCSSAPNEDTGYVEDDLHEGYGYGR